MPFPPYAAEIFSGAESQGADERAPAAMDRMGLMVRRVTGMDTKSFMRTRAASDCGDGQMCAGGEEALHPSTAAMNKLWTEVANLDCGNASCDGLHQLNAAGREALSQYGMLLQVCDVFKKQEHMSAIGQGEELRSGLAEYLGGTRLPRHCDLRPQDIGYISGVAGIVLDTSRLDHDT